MYVKKCIKVDKKLSIRHQRLASVCVSSPSFLLPPNPMPCHFFGKKQQVVEDGYEFFARRQLVTLFSAPNYCGEFDNAGAMMSVDETLMCSFQVHD